MPDDNSRRNRLFDKQPLLEHHALLYTPHNINDDTVPELIWALVEARRMYPTDPIHLIVTGWGGHAETSFSLYDVIRQDGNIWGYLLGVAASGHSLIWSACNRRFIYPNASFAIHRATLWYNRDNQKVMDMRNASLISQRLDLMDKTIAQMYALAGNKEYNWWLQQLNKAQGEDTLVFSSQDLVSMEMGEYAQTNPFVLARIEPPAAPAEAVPTDSPPSVAEGKAD